MTSDTFGVHQCTVWETLSEVCKVINEILGPKYLYFSRNTEEMRESIKMWIKFGIPQGCIDGTHVPLKRPLKRLV